MKELIEKLHSEHCSLVLRDTEGNVRCFYKQGVRDLEDLLDKEPATLQGALIADKVIGKAAAGMMAHGGVKEVYAEVMSPKAIPMLEQYGIIYSYGQLVEGIVIPEGDDRCPLESIVAPATTAEETVHLLRAHFEEMKRSKKIFCDDPTRSSQKTNNYHQ